MKGKTLIAIVLAVLMVASIVSAASLSTILYNRISPKEAATSAAADTAKADSSKQVAAVQRQGIQTITNPAQRVAGSCSTQNDCPNGNCMCKCATKPAASNPGVLSSLTGKATIPISNLKLSPSTASTRTLIATNGKAAGVSCTTAPECTSKICGRATTSASKVCKTTCSLASDCETGKACTSGKCVTPASPRTAGQSCSTTQPCATGLTCTSNVCARPAAATGGAAGTGAGVSSSAGTEADSVGTCQSACLARCRAACTPAGTDSTGTLSCASNADCTSGYCNPNRVCASCTLNSQCGTGKACIIARLNEGMCAPLQANGGVCNENSDCSSNNCASIVLTGSLRVGTCAAAASGSGTRILGTNLNLLTGKAIDLGGLRLQPGTGSSGTLTTGTSGSTGTPALPSNGAVCTSALQCTSKICKLQQATATAAARKTCSATCSLSTDCETGKACSSGRCVAQAAPRTAGQSCSATQRCATGLTCTSNVCVAQAAARTAGQSCSTTQPCATGLACTGNVCATPAAADTGDAVTGIDASSVGRCQAACTESCRLECTPSGERTPPPAGSDVATLGKKRIGEVCSSSEGCRTECESEYGECSCEGAAVAPAKKKEGELCSDNADCDAGLECTGLALFGKKCTKIEESADEETGIEKAAAVEALTPEVQAQVRTQLDALEPKLEQMELQVVADSLVASREALIALSTRSDCYVPIDNVELKAECIKIRFETVTNLLESRGLITADKAREWKTRVGGQAVGQERRAEAQALPSPEARRTFTQRVRDVFRFTGSFWRVTGGFVVEETEVQVGTAGEELRVTQAVPTNYLNDLDTQYSQLASLETDICAGYPTTLTVAAVLKSCTTNLQCGASGAVKCVSGKCSVNKEDVCSTGEFSGATPAGTVVTDTDIDEILSEGGPIGSVCSERYDCASHYCYKPVSFAPGTCRACTSNANCATGKICSAGVCQ